MLAGASTPLSPKCVAGARDDSTAVVRTEADFEDGADSEMIDATTRCRVVRYAFKTDGEVMRRVARVPRNENLAALRRNHVHLAITVDVHRRPAVRTERSFFWRGQNFDAPRPHTGPRIIADPFEVGIVVEVGEQRLTLKPFAGFDTIDGPNADIRRVGKRDLRLVFAADDDVPSDVAVDVFDRDRKRLPDRRDVFQVTQSELKVQQVFQDADATTVSVQRHHVQIEVTIDVGEGHVDDRIVGVHGSRTDRNFEERSVSAIDERAESARRIRED